MKIVIVGAVAGGASAAARARRLSEDAEILVVERGPQPSFANCGLPYYIGGIIPKREKLIVAPIEMLRRRFRLDLRTETEVVAIELPQKHVRLKNLVTGEVETLSFDKLILSPGAAPFVPPTPGIKSPRIFTLRDLRDADRLHRHAAEAKTALIVGGGFIGLELAESLSHRGIAVTLVELNPQVLTPLDREMAAPLAQELIRQGVTLKLENSVTSFRDTDTGVVAHFANGDEAEFSLAIVAVGVRPENKLASDAGLSIGPRGGIQVNSHMQTSHPDIYAVGDAVETREFPSKIATQVPLAGPANRQGRIAADHIFGGKSSYRGTQGTAIVKAFGKTAAITGYSEKAAQRAGVTYEKIYLHPNDHAGYYPGAQQFVLKLLFDPRNGKVLGAQAVGGAGVDKRIDVIAMAIQAGMTVHDLEQVELCYAPQFGSAKDPVNMAGFIAANVMSGDHPIIHVNELEELEDRVLRLDVRTPAEFAAGAIPGAINIPVDDLRDRLDDLPNDHPIVAYCRVGQRGYLATRLLRQRGFDVRNLSGGYLTWDQFIQAGTLPAGTCQR